MRQNKQLFITYISYESNLILAVRRQFYRAHFISEVISKDKGCTTPVFHYHISNLLLVYNPLKGKVNQHFKVFLLIIVFGQGKQEFSKKSYFFYLMLLVYYLLKIKYPFFIFYFLYFFESGCFSYFNCYTYV